MSVTLVMFGERPSIGGDESDLAQDRPSIAPIRLRERHCNDRMRTVVSASTAIAPVADIGRTMPPLRDEQRQTR